jgi:hypothetical protein
MPNFKFECEHSNAWDQTLDSKVTMEFDKEFLPDVIEQFEQFLRGCGYYFDGRLELVEDEPVEQEFNNDVMGWTVNELTKEQNANQG